ncbi:MAG: hypothetical protein ACI8RD_001297 [Bacillariaceae sp.]|jgi:hypothetical protein
MNYYSYIVTILLSLINIILVSVVLVFAFVLLEADQIVDGGILMYFYWNLHICMM